MRMEREDRGRWQYAEAAEVNGEEGGEKSSMEMEMELQFGLSTLSRQNRGKLNHKLTLELGFFSATVQVAGLTSCVSHARR
jgi:hypothetical protein